MTCFIEDAIVNVNDNDSDDDEDDDCDNDDDDDNGDDGDYDDDDDDDDGVLVSDKTTLPTADAFCGHPARGVPVLPHCHDGDDDGGGDGGDGGACDDGDDDSGDGGRDDDGDDDNDGVRYEYYDKGPVMMVTILTPRISF